MRIPPLRKNPESSAFLWSNVSDSHDQPTCRQFRRDDGRNFDIPDTLLRQLQARAALRGETLKQCLLRAVCAELRSDGESSDLSSLEGSLRIKLPIVESKEASYGLSSKWLTKIQEKEDLELLAGQ